jgi:hypothetical protein
MSWSMRTTWNRLPMMELKLISAHALRSNTLVTTLDLTSSKMVTHVCNCSFSYGHSCNILSRRLILWIIFVNDPEVVVGFNTTQAKSRSSICQHMLSVSRLNWERSASSCAFVRLARLALSLFIPISLYYNNLIGELFGRWANIAYNFNSEYDTSYKHD